MNQNFFKKIFILGILVFVFFAIFSISLKAENKVAFTITPPLIKTNVVPGQTWKTSIKVVNNNASSLTLYASVFDFKSDINGGVSFYLGEKTQDSAKIFASQWIKIGSEPIELGPYQSQVIPFSVYVPEDAEPGGHYVAIVLGTRPANQEKIKGTAINISSAIASLILLRVKGDIIEKGRIRDFYTKKNIYDKPDVDLNLTFENLGNVHLHPVGAIKIYNMWGKERGRIPINENTYFGNVLPRSKRTWKFEWKGENSLFEIGRYKAQIFLTFGKTAKQTSSRELYFWIIPLIPTAIVLGIFTILILIIILSVRLYIKKAILLAQKQAGIPPSQVRISAKVLEAPIKEMIVDLSKINQQEKTVSLPNIAPERRGLSWLFKKYYRAVIFLVALIFWILASIVYFQDTLKPQKSFEVIQEIRGKKSVLVPRRQSRNLSSTPTPASFSPVPTNSAVQKKEKQKETIGMQNKSGKKELGEKVSKLIEKNNYKVFVLPETASTIERSIVKYKKGYKDLAKKINTILGSYAILMEENNQNFNIVVFVGEDLINNENKEF